jgi:putative lipoic acid-binding regulatory protein
LWLVIYKINTKNKEFMVNDKDAFYSKLKVQLDDTTEFPADYMYKFIVPTTANQVKEVEDLFHKAGAVINTKKSKTGKYASLTIVIKMKNSETIIAYYKKAEKIKGIVSL